MTLLLTVIHVAVCLFLIFVVLLQSAQAADLAGAFGGGGSQTALGMRSATTLLQKATTLAAVIFMITSLGLGLAERSSSSVIEGLGDPDVPAAMDTAPEAEQAPAAVDGEQSATDGEGEQAADEGSDGATTGEQSGEGGGEQQPD